MEHPEVVFEGRRYWVSRDYYTSHDPERVSDRFLHRAIFENEYGPIPKGFEIHHIDGNKLNNELSNLVLLTKSEHRYYHGKTGKWSTSERNLKEVIPKARALSDVARRQPENRARNADRWKTNTKLHAWIGSEGAKVALEKARLAASEWHKSDEGRAWHSEQHKINWEGKKPVPAFCTVCGKEYLTYFPTRSKFCHQNCKAKALRRRRAAGL